MGLAILPWYAWPASRSRAGAVRPVMTEFALPAQEIHASTPRRRRSRPRSRRRLHSCRTASSSGGGLRRSRHGSGEGIGPTPCPRIRAPAGHRVETEC
ncbi:MAG: hypothetical protein MZV49_05885 [Rhodopseudomonas palustris]|nr:hypothetical protein [Rhodopseudomonas palustris]